MEKIDLDATRTAVCLWLDEHHDGTLAQMVNELEHRYPDCPEMAVVPRDMMAAELRRRTQPSAATSTAGVPW
jgi:hypothetical protein